MWRRISGVAFMALLAGAVLGSRDGESTAPHEGAVADNHLGATGQKNDRSATVWAVGDGADGRDAAKALAARIASGGVDRFLYLGDVYEKGTRSEFEQHYATVYGPLAGRTAPTPGNHDWAHREEGYHPYWERVFGNRLPAYYSFLLAGWRILSLNSETEHDPGSAQVKWLKAKLRRRGTCRLAFWHRPPFSAGKVHGDQRDVVPLWDALRGRAALVVNGHEHDMQRLKPRDGMVQLISGAGGHGHHGVNRGDERLAFTNDDQYGALRLKLRRGRAKFAFITTDGRTLDSGVVRCRTK